MRIIAEGDVLEEDMAHYYNNHLVVQNDGWMAYCSGWLAVVDGLP